MCAYNPAQPTFAYFTVGDAVAALGFTLAIQQLFRPIYLFRLRAYGLKIAYLFGAVFLGALCAGVAMLVPNLPISHTGMLAYPIFWELLAGFLIASAYGAAATISLTRARIYSFNIRSFVRAASTLLSAANDDDRANLAEDILLIENIERLFHFASAWRAAEEHATHVVLEGLRERGQPLQFTGRPPISAFYLFAHRRELALATLAGQFLQILADPDFCAVLVRRCPWQTAATLREIAEKRIAADQAKTLVQEIARQAILNDDSLLAKEVGYTGFGSAPLLASSLFGNWFILFYFDPLQGLGYGGSRGSPTPGFVSRLNGATKTMVKTAIKAGEYWPQGYMHSVKSVYEAVSRDWSIKRSAKQQIDFAVEFHFGIQGLYKELQDGLSKLAWDRKKSLFVTNTQEHRADLVAIVADIVYDSLVSVAGGFHGGDDEAWFHVIGILTEIYPPYGDMPLGMNPLQQQLALRFLDTLRRNMQGWDRPISRVLILGLGPYKSEPKRTAHSILLDAVYKELQGLSALQAKAPETLDRYLPPNTSYDSESDSITRTFRDGGIVSTRLADLHIPEIDLTNQQYWQVA